MGRTIFRQITNQQKDIEALADGYKLKAGHELWLADGLQKDAIQNCWDARKDKKHGKDWECGFTLQKLGSKEVLCISDLGTTGLNGTMFNNDTELVGILNENKTGEDLAYFLNSNWSAKSSEEGGNRGRGKTLFLAASREKKIYFDSLRISDNEYIFGELFLDFDKQVKFSLHYGDGGQAMFKEIMGNDAKQLNSFGTRIFILNPDPLVTKAIKDGEMLSFISNSRWETIKKYNARIFVDNGKEKKYASLPYWYEPKFKDVFEKECPPEKIKDGTDYKIKRLILRYAPKLNLAESVKGIAIQRGGMTIERIPAEDLVREEGMNDVYGWLEMEGDPLEQEMKTLCEGPEHFDFSWTLKPAKYLRDFLRLKVREFAKDLNLDSELAKKNKIQKTAEEEALKLLTPLFKSLGLFGKHKGKKKKNITFRKENELLRLSICDLEFPRDNRRVNYGEEIKGAYVVPFNGYDESILVLVRVFIVSFDGKSEMLEEKEINLSQGKGVKIGKDSFPISKRFVKGGYSLRAKMVSLEEKNITLSDGTKVEKGTVLYDRINQKFYVEMDPPESGPINFQPKGKEDKTYLFDWESDGDGYIVYYNDLHPRIKSISDDQEKLRDYLLEQGIILALQIKLEETIADDDATDEDFTKIIDSKNLAGVVNLFLRRYSEFLWDLKK